MDLLDLLYISLIIGIMAFILIAAYVAQQLVQTLHAIEQVVLDMKNLSAEATRLKSLAKAGTWGVIGKLLQPFAERR